MAVNTTAISGKIGAPAQSPSTSGTGTEKATEQGEDWHGKSI